MKLPQPMKRVFLIISETISCRKFYDNTFSPTIEVYRKLLVADFEIEPFAISDQIEYVFVLFLVFFVGMEPDTRRVTPIRIMVDVVIIFITYQV